MKSVARQPPCSSILNESLFALDTVGSTTKSAKTVLTVDIGLWDKQAFRYAIEAAEGFAEDAWCLEEEATAEAKAKAKAKPGRPAPRSRGGTHDLIYGAMPIRSSTMASGTAPANYLDRLVESAINQIVAKRFSKRQSMRWTEPGAHLVLQTRTRVLNSELQDVFRQWWPAFRPLPEAEAAAGNRSYA